MMLALVIGGFTGWQFAKVPTDLRPIEDQGNVMVNPQLPDATSLERTQ